MNRKPTQAQRGRMRLLSAYKQDPEGFKTIQLSEFSFTGDRKVYVQSTHKTGKD